MRLWSSLSRQVTASLVLLVSTASSQTLDMIPPCYQDCIKNSGDFTCNGLDIACICRLSNGNYLTDVITCIKSNCDNTLDTNNLLGPLQLGCNLVGVPISPAAIANAQGIGSSKVPSTATGKFSITSTFASAGTTFVVVAPVSVKSAQFGYQTSTGVVSTSTAKPSSSRSGRTASRTGSSPSSTGAGAAASSSTDSSSSEDSSSVSTVSTTSTTSTSTEATSSTTTTSGGSNAQSSLSSAVASTTSNSGTPFSAGGQICVQKGNTWLGFVVGVLAGAMWL